MYRFSTLILNSALILTGFVARPAFAEDWPQWRGPLRDGVSAEDELLSEWPPEGPPLAWRAEGLGEGYSSVAVSQAMAFTIGKLEDGVVACTAVRAADGRTAWIRRLGKSSRMPCSTPTVDGARVYVLGPDGDLTCLLASDGAIVWRVDLTGAPWHGVPMSGRGYGESPLIAGARLFCTPGGPEATLVALDKRTGSEVWRSRVPELGPEGRDGAGFSSIVLSRGAGVEQLVQLVGRGLVGVRAADGKFLWGYNKIANATANIPTPVARGDFVFAANGYNKGAALLQLRAGEDGGVDAREVYSLSGSQFQNHHGGVVRRGRHLFGGHGSNNGFPTCVEWETGRIVWKRRGPGVGSASVIAADGRLYFHYQDGTVALLSASDEAFELRGTLKIPDAGGDSWAHPAISDGRLFLREKDRLWVYDIRRGEGAAPASAASGSPSGAAPASLAGGGIPAERLGRQHPWYSLVDTPPAWLADLSDKHLTPEGGIQPGVAERLRTAAAPLALSFAGSRIGLQGIRQAVELEPVAMNLELCGQLDGAAWTALAECPSLQVIVATGTAIRAEDLTALGRLPHLKALDLEACDAVDDAACRAIAALSSLRAVSLKKTGFETERITDAGLRALAAADQLECLSLYGNRVTDEGLQSLAPWTGLRELDLSLTAVTDKGLKTLASQGRLERLVLVYSTGFLGPKITDRGAESLASLRNLRHLSLIGAQLTDQGLSRLESLSRLERLEIVHTRVTPQGVEAFQQAVPACRIRQ